MLHISIYFYASTGGILFFSIAWRILPLQHRNGVLIFAPDPCATCISFIVHGHSKAQSIDEEIKEYTFVQSGRMQRLSHLSSVEGRSAVVWSWIDH